MSRLPESQNYLMKCLGFVLLLGFISLGAIGGCGNNTADEPDPIDDFLNIVKTLNVEMDNADLEMLVNAGLKLNISKRVGNNIFNVVWLSISDYGETNTYQWSPIFRLFISNPFKEGDQVEINPLSIDVALGQVVTLEPIGELFVADDEAPADSISFFNNTESPIPIGLAQQLTIPGILQEILPTFVNPDSIEPETITSEAFTPMDEVMVWFEDTETSTMFSDARPNSVLVDLTNIDEITVSFSKGEWSVQ